MAAALDTAPGNDRHFLPKPLPLFWDDDAKSFYGNYTGLKGEELDEHIVTVRNRAWQIEQYGCLGMWTFLRYDLKNRSIYPQLLDRIRSGGRVLDIGCGLGQDLRRIVFESGVGMDYKGAYASDLRPTLWQLGFDMFLDKDTFHPTFVAGNLKEDGAALWDQLGAGDDKFQVIIANAIFHFFTWDQQVKLFTLFTQKITTTGSVLVGTQMGRAEGMAEEQQSRNDGLSFRHDELSWRKIWQEVNEATGAKWTVPEFEYVVIPEALRPLASATSSQHTRVVRFAVVRED